MPPLGDGFYLNRRTHRLIRIWEHAEDSVKFPKKFHSQAVAHLNPAEERDKIVIHTLRVGGFIRVRHYKEFLGFQFWGDPDEALADLRRYCRKKEVGPTTLVTVTDFSTRLNLVALWMSIGTTATAFDLGLAKKPPCISKPKIRRPR